MGGQQAVAERTATLVIGDWRSTCSNCQTPAFWQDTHHVRMTGDARKQPCGARFTAMRHADGRGKEHILRPMRPDLPIT